jgi:hypothetical protein
MKAERTLNETIVPPLTKALEVALKTTLNFSFFGYYVYEVSIPHIND